MFRSHEVRQGASPFHPLRFCQSIIELDGYAIEHDGLCTTVC